MVEIAPTSFSLMKPDAWMIDFIKVHLSESGKISGITVGQGKSPSLSRINGLFEKIQNTLANGFPEYLPFFIEMMEAGNQVTKNYLLVYRRKDHRSDNITYRLDACYSYQKRNYVMGTQYCADHTFDLVFYLGDKETRRLPLKQVNFPSAPGQPSKKLLSLKAKEKPKLKETPTMKPVEQVANPIVNKPVVAAKAVIQPVRKVHRLTAKAVEKPKEEMEPMKPSEPINGKVFNEVTRKIELLDYTALKELQRQIESLILVADSLAAVEAAKVNGEGVNPTSDKKRGSLLQYAKKLLRRK